jgi:hypothetical protein
MGTTPVEGVSALQATLDDATIGIAMEVTLLRGTTLRSQSITPVELGG